MFTNVIMNIENCITATYGLIALTYTSHIIQMRYYDLVCVSKKSMSKKYILPDNRYLKVDIS